jgi:hypothetical protein
VEAERLLVLQMEIVALRIVVLEKYQMILITIVEIIIAIIMTIRIAKWKNQTGLMRIIPMITGKAMTVVAVAPAAPPWIVLAEVAFAVPP